MGTLFEYPQNKAYSSLGSILVSLILRSYHIRVYAHVDTHAYTLMKVLRLRCSSGYLRRV